MRIPANWSRNGERWLSLRVLETVDCNDDVVGIDSVTGDSPCRVYASLDDFWLDEIWSLTMARDVASAWDILTKIHHDNNHYLNTWLMHALGPSRHWSVYRIPAVLASVATVMIAGMIGWRQGAVAGLTAMTLIGGSYVLVQYSSEARGYAYLMLFSLAAVYLMQSVLDRGRWPTQLLVSITSSLGFLAHATYVYCFLPLIFWSIWSGLQRKWSGRALGLMLLRCHALPCLLITWLYFADYRQLTIGGGDDAHDIDVLRSALSLVVGGPRAGSRATIMALASIAAYLAGMVCLFRSGSDIWVYYLGAVVIGPLVVIGIAPQNPLYVRYFLVNILFLLMLLSDLFARLVRHGSWGKCAFGGVLLIVLAGNAVHTTRFLREGRGHYLAATRLIDQQTVRSEITVGSDHDFRNRLVLRFYHEHLREDGKRLVYFEADQWPRQGPEWVLHHSLERNYQPEPSISDGAGNHYRLVELFRYAGLSGWHWAVYHNTADQKVK